MGDLSAHFSRSEFVCPHCGRLIGPDGELVAVLERIRHRAARPVRVVSGYRCETHNAAVGGARASYHLRGLAADIPVGLATVADAIAAGARGIGTRGDWVVHVDVRPTRRPVIFRDD